LELVRDRVPDWNVSPFSIPAIAQLWVAVNKFRDAGLFVLDEPEAALSPQRQLALLARIHQLVQAGSQLIISTHSPILLAYPNSTIFLLDHTGIHQTRYGDSEPSLPAGDSRTRLR
jgi:predicted ATPase